MLGSQERLEVESVSFCFEELLLLLLLELLLEVLLLLDPWLLLELLLVRLLLLLEELELLLELAWFEDLLESSCVVLSLGRTFVVLGDAATMMLVVGLMVHSSAEDCCVVGLLQ